MRGFNNPAYQAEVIERTAKTVKDARRRLAPRRWTWLAERPLEDLHADYALGRDLGLTAVALLTPLPEMNSRRW